MSERFYVREHSGFVNTVTRSQAKLRTDVMVIDRDYCHRVVRSWVRPAWSHKTVGFVLVGFRREAEALCAELNRWHEQATL